MHSNASWAVGTDCLTRYGNKQACNFHMQTQNAMLFLIPKGNNKKQGVPDKELYCSSTKQYPIINCLNSWWFIRLSWNHPRKLSCSDDFQITIKCLQMFILSSVFLGMSSDLALELVTCDRICTHIFMEGLNGVKASTIYFPYAVHIDEAKSGLIASQHSTMKTQRIPIQFKNTLLIKEIQNSINYNCSELISLSFYLLLTLLHVTNILQ